MEEMRKYIQDTQRKSILDDKVGNQIGINLTQTQVEISERGERILIGR
jgi:hypothetical protein